MVLEFAVVTERKDGCLQSVSVCSQGHLGAGFLRCIIISGHSTSLCTLLDHVSLTKQSLIALSSLVLVTSLVQSCTHQLCMTHRQPSAHSCSSSPAGTRSSTPTPPPRPSGLRQILAGPSREAALAAIKRNPGATSSPAVRSPPPLKPLGATPVTAKEVKPLTPAQKDRDPNEKKSAIKPLHNPLSATSR